MTKRKYGLIPSYVDAVLNRAKKDLTTAEIRDRVVEDHPEEDTKNLYLTIYQYLKRRGLLTVEGRS